MTLVLGGVDEGGHVHAMAGSEGLDLVVGADLVPLVGWERDPVAEIEDVHGKYRTRCGPTHWVSRSGSFRHTRIANENFGLRGLRSGSALPCGRWYW